METFQQPKITGYRQLSEEEVALMNEAKALAEQCGALNVLTSSDPGHLAAVPGASPARTGPGSSLQRSHMTDDEFLNDRDCTPRPQGDTPRTDAAARVICGHAIVPQWIAIGGAQEVVSAEFARDLERELARALRVVEAAKALADNCEDDGLGYAAQGMYWHDLDNALQEWEAGR